MRHGFFKGVILGAVTSTLVLAAATAMAGTGIGAVFNIGKTNTVDAQSTLKGSSSGKTLQLTNSGAGSALGLSVATGKAPLTVNSGVKVAKLNADRLDGIDSDGFLRANGKAQDAVHADTADSADEATHAAGANIASVAQVAFNANDAGQLGGFPPSHYATQCGEGTIHGFVAVNASSSFSSTYTSSGLIAANNCVSGGAVQVRRSAEGVYLVRFVSNPSILAVGNAYEADTDEIVVVSRVTDQAGTGNATEKVFQVDLWDKDGGHADTDFELVLV